MHLAGVELWLALPCHPDHGGGDGGDSPCCVLAEEMSAETPLHCCSDHVALFPVSLGKESRPKGFDTSPENILVS